MINKKLFPNSINIFNDPTIVWGLPWQIILIIISVGALLVLIGQYLYKHLACKDNFVEQEIKKEQKEIEKLKKLLKISVNKK